MVVDPPPSRFKADCGFVSPKCIDRIAYRTNAIATEIVGRISHANHFIFHIGKSDIHPVGKIFPYFILPSQSDFPTFVLNLTGILVAELVYHYLRVFASPYRYKKASLWRRVERISTCGKPAASHLAKTGHTTCSVG